MFTNREYIDKKSAPEIGISSAKLYFEKNNSYNDNALYYCIANGWECDTEKFEIIIKQNYIISRNILYNILKGIK